MSSKQGPAMKNRRTSVYALRFKDNPAIGMSRFKFYYKTTSDDRQWLADIDEEVMREPSTFKINPEPCGMGFPNVVSMREWMKLKCAKCVGFIERGKLYITKRIRIETGGEMFSTRFSSIYPSSVLPRHRKRKVSA